MRRRDILNALSLGALLTVSFPFSSALAQQIIGERAPDEGRPGSTAESRSTAGSQTPGVNDRRSELVSGDSSSGPAAPRERARFGSSSDVPTAIAEGPELDRLFVEQASQSGLAEVRLGRLAAEKASEQAIKEFGQMMVSDHSRANDKLKAIAERKGLSVATELGMEHAQAERRISALSGERFDRAYIQQMVADHKKAIDLFERQESRGGDTELQAFAKESLPLLRTHLIRAENLAATWP